MKLRPPLLSTAVIVSLIVSSTVAALAVPVSFALEYESRGSMYPATTRITLDGDGNYVRERRVRGSEYGPRRERVTGRLPAAALAAFIKELVDGRGFFSLPATFTVERATKDMGTQWLQVTHGGRTHKIGGYDAWSYKGYKGVCRLVEELEIQLVDKQVEKSGK